MIFAGIGKNLRKRNQMPEIVHTFFGDIEYMRLFNVINAVLVIFCAIVVITMARK